MGWSDEEWAGIKKGNANGRCTYCRVLLSEHVGILCEGRTILRQRWLREAAFNKKKATSYRLRREASNNEDARLQKQRRLANPPAPNAPAKILKESREVYDDAFGRTRTEYRNLYPGRCEYCSEYMWHAEGCTHPDASMPEGGPWTVATS